MTAEKIPKTEAMRQGRSLSQEVEVMSGEVLLAETHYTSATHH